MYQKRSPANPAGSKIAVCRMTEPRLFGSTSNRSQARPGTFISATRPSSRSGTKVSTRQKSRASLRKACEDRDGPGAVPRPLQRDLRGPETTKEHWQSTNHSNLQCAESEQKLPLEEPILARSENRRADSQTSCHPTTAAYPPRRERRTNWSGQIPGLHGEELSPSLLANFSA